MSDSHDSTQDAAGQEPLTLGPSTAARNRLLPEGRVTGPMPWVLAIITLLTVLATAAGLSMGAAVYELRNQLSGSFTVQIVAADRNQRALQVNAAVGMLSKEKLVTGITVIPESELANQMRPWLGDDIATAGLPIPALIDARIRDEAALPSLIARLQSALPNVQVEASANFLTPVVRAMRTLMWMAALIVALMLIATAAIVVLAARGAHEAHRGTIDILHLLGATDAQIARLFQRRLALDAAFAGILGLISAAAILLLLGQNTGGAASELMRLMQFPVWGWMVLPFIPVMTVLLSTVSARITVRRALERSL